jgi:nucleoside 2-deoxyribosyltransferase
VGDERNRICSRHGLGGVFPFDAGFEVERLAPVGQGRRIFGDTIELADTCGFVIQNLTPFHATSMDVGTAIEIGYFWGRGKPVFGYTNVAASYAERVKPDRMFVGSSTSWTT